MAVYEVETDDGSVYQVETEDSGPQKQEPTSMAGMASNALGSIPRPPVMPSEVVQGLSSIASPLTSNTGEAMSRAAESAGKSAEAITGVGSIADRLASNPNFIGQSPEIKAAILTPLDMALESASPSSLAPESVSAALAMDLAGPLARPSAKINPKLSPIQREAVSMGETSIQTPQNIALSRLDRGRRTVSEEIFKRKELGSNYNDIYSNAKKILGSLNDRAQAFIDKKTSEVTSRTGKDIQVEGTPLLEYKPKQEIQQTRLEPTNIGETYTPDVERFIDPLTNKDMRGQQIQLENFDTGSPVSGKIPKEYREILQNTVDLENSKPKYEFKIQKDGVFNRSDFLKAIDSVSEKIKETSGDRLSMNAYRRVKEDIASAGNEKMTIRDAMELKKQLNDEINDAYAKPDEKLSARILAKEKVANSIRKIVYDKYPELKQIMMEESVMMDILNSTKKRVNKQANLSLMQRLLSKNLKVAREIGRAHV